MSVPSLSSNFWKHSGKDQEELPVSDDENGLTFRSPSTESLEYPPPTYKIFREAPIHRAWSCEFPNCPTTFYTGGSHDCQICGLTVCEMHNVEFVELPTKLLTRVEDALENITTPVLAFIISSSSSSEELPAMLTFRCVCLECCERSLHSAGGGVKIEKAQIAPYSIGVVDVDVDGGAGQGQKVELNADIHASPEVTENMQWLGDKELVGKVAAMKERKRQMAAQDRARSHHLRDIEEQCVEAVKRGEKNVRDERELREARAEEEALFAQIRQRELDRDAAEELAKLADAAVVHDEAGQVETENTEKEEKAEEEESAPTALLALTDAQRLLLLGDRQRAVEAMGELSLTLLAMEGASSVEKEELFLEYMHGKQLDAELSLRAREDSELVGELLQQGMAAVRREHAEAEARRSEREAAERENVARQRERERDEERATQQQAEEISELRRAMRAAQAAKLTQRTLELVARLMHMGTVGAEEKRALAGAKAQQFAEETVQAVAAVKMEAEAVILAQTEAVIPAQTEAAAKAQAQADAAADADAEAAAKRLLVQYVRRHRRLSLFGSNRILKMGGGGTEVGAGADAGGWFLTPDMLVLNARLSLNTPEADLLREESAKNPSILVGFQIVLPYVGGMVREFEKAGAWRGVGLGRGMRMGEEGSWFECSGTGAGAGAGGANIDMIIGSHAGVLGLPEIDPSNIYIILDVAKDSIRRTEFRISNGMSGDCWAKLRRGKSGTGHSGNEGCKEGMPFRPLRRVTAKAGKGKTSEDVRL
ncbi:hypothetical protein B484DRAFT_453275 [Ochromonadaceae sp. CCMP2298]|nr:hypothetical protein B484DRAFT_453275 [Ochromonadaceae sp. CCMP2298]